MFVFVINKHGKPLMPCSPRKAKILLREKKARVVSRVPFTIKLLFGSAGHRQEIIAGMDSGGEVIGTSAKGNGKTYYLSETKMRGEEIKGKLEQRRMYRRNRRGRKCRYRKPRFLNRGNSIKKGRIPPSVRHKIAAHEREKKFVEKILPVTRWKVETASFDIHKITNPTVSGAGYQNGQKKNFYNVKAFVLSRDNHKCQYGKGKCSQKLHVHHIVVRSQGGTDKPENLITLCERHHAELHAGKLGDFLRLEKGLSKKAQGKVKNATQVSMVSSFIRKNWFFDETFGYETKLKRETLGLPKTHFFDALAIALDDGETVEITDIVYKKRCVARGDYQQTSGARSEKKIPTGKLFGLRKFDEVETSKSRGFVKGKRSSGYFSISDIDGNSIDDSVNVKKGAKRMRARKSVIISAANARQFLRLSEEQAVSLAENL